MSTTERRELKVRAWQVRAGDWTRFTGWHPVKDVRPLSGDRTGLVRENGKMDKLYDHQFVTVYRDQQADVPTTVSE